MKKIKRIMAACDLSAYSPKVISHAGQLAESLKGELILVNVINQRDIDAIEGAFRRISMGEDTASAAGYIGEMKIERTNSLKEMIREAGLAHLPMRLVFRVGIPHEQLMRAAENEAADILVMGTKGRGNLAGVFFGSTAEKMFQQCPVPLLSIRLKKDTQ